MSIPSINEHILLSSINDNEHPAPLPRFKRCVLLSSDLLGRLSHGAITRNALASGCRNAENAIQQRLLSDQMMKRSSGRRQLVHRQKSCACYPAGCCLTSDGDHALFNASYL
eukprot:1161899-Pelagomonas_calceolata.AAC.8